MRTTACPQPKSAKRHDDSPKAKEARIVERRFVDRQIPKRKKGRHLYVSVTHFKRDVHLFDEEITKKYTKGQIGTVLKLIFKKVAERIITKMWRMPFPNGMGRMYMREKQLDVSQYTREDPDTPEDHELEAMLRECQLGMKRTHLKWNKDGTPRSPYKGIWRIKRSEGYFRSVLFSEVLRRAEDPTVKNFRGHLA